MRVSYDHQYIPSTADINLGLKYSVKNYSQNRTFSGMPGQETNSAHGTRKFAEVMKELKAMKRLWMCETGKQEPWSAN